MKTKKLIIFLITILICFNVFVPNVFAQDARPLETDYIDVSKGITPEGVETTTLPRYAEYLYYFLIWASGILALLALIYAGFKYLTSSGSPDKLKDARNGIFSALLGLVIILGSYAILSKINPNFLTWNLPRLKPIITSLSPGVWACKTQDIDNDIRETWTLNHKYFTTNPDNLTVEEVRKMKIRMDELLANIAKECYRVTGSGTVKSDFNNKIKRIWIIPERSYFKFGNDIEIKQEFHYGTIVFQKEKYSGLSNVFFNHLILGGLRGPLSFEPNLDVSSIILYRRNIPLYVNGKLRATPELRALYPDSESWDNTPLWSVDLYEETSYNAGLVDENNNPLPSYFSIENVSFFASRGELDPITGNLAPAPIRKGDPDIYDMKMEGVPWPPKSIRINGDALVLLYKGAFKKRVKADQWEIAEPQKEGKNIGWYLEAFFSNDSNLEDNHNIVEWKDCKNYQGTEMKQEKQETGSWGGGKLYTNVCAWAAADGIIILAGIKQL